MDLDTWRLHFEDLPAWWPPDWDFNDAVVLIDIVNQNGNNSNQSINDTDCDNDGIVNWLDNNDSDCDFGEEDSEINEEDNHDNFNVEGHILFHGKYGKGNKYVCGDKLKFMMFGINNRTEDENITFLIEDHSDKKGVQGDWVYNGSISNENETLLVPNNGTKVHKIFEFEIPCSFNAGKHDIHIIWKGEKLHKIGNFFVVEDTTPPWINTQKNASGFPRENISVWYSAGDPPEEGTLRELELSVAEAANESLSISVDTGIEGAEKITVEGGSKIINLTYNQSGEYLVNLTVKDKSGKNASVTIPVTVFITEEEAQEIAYPIYVSFGVAPLEFYNDTDLNIDNETVNVDRWNDLYLVGDEYLTENDDLGEVNISGQEENIKDCSEARLIKPIFPSTAMDFETTLINYLTHLKDDCNRI